MKNLCLVLWIFLLSNSYGAAMNSCVEIETAAALAISTALRDAQEKIKIDYYKIILSENENEFHVSFMATDTPAGQRGSTPGKPGINYILDKTELKILRVYWTR